jgi:hypothetical protein
MKWILVVPLCLALAGCAVKTQSAESTPESKANVVAIEKVLREDREAANAETVPEITRRMQAIDTSGCPKDFQLAYSKHCQAWKTKELYLATIPQEDLAGVLSIMSAMTKGELDGGNARVKREAAEKQQAVVDTWYEVERMAIGYGARVK